MTANLKIWNEMTANLKIWNEMTDAERAERRALPKAERQELSLRANLSRPAPSPTGRLRKSKRGTWGRVLLSGCRAGCVAALTAAECVAAGLEPGPGND